jgi:hypothetical protein
MGIYKPSFFDYYKKHVEEWMRAKIPIPLIYEKLKKTVPKSKKIPGINSFYKWFKSRYPDYKKEPKIIEKKEPRIVKEIRLDEPTREEIKDLKEKWKTVDDAAYDIINKQKRALDEIWSYKKDFATEKIDITIMNKMGFLQQFITVCGKVTKSLSQLTGGRAFYIPETEESGELSKEVQKEQIVQLARIEAELKLDTNIGEILEIEAEEIKSDETKN